MQTEAAAAGEPINFFPAALGPPASARRFHTRATARLAEAPKARRRHPQRVLTLMPRLGFARPRLGMAAGAAVLCLQPVRPILPIQPFCFVPSWWLL
jgi:hypothetical protein